jgi:2-keto-4-pentenoate hydratase/2-oxohepta-3-ene-1,7-dioic acid hydratase in catechol pathway
MRFVNFSTPDNPDFRLGLYTDKGVLDFPANGPQNNANLPHRLANLFEWNLSDLREQLALIDDYLIYSDPASVTYGPCLDTPQKIICVGLNYKRHAQESGLETPATPVLFSKFNNSLAGYQEEIPLPTSAVQYDYEVELGVVIGKQARYVSEAEALDYVFGYCTVNDLSVRDLQFRTSQWLLGKTLDKFMPVGPYLVTADEVKDPQNLELTCWVNGQKRQHSNTSDMIFSVAQIISYISQYMTLCPGDLISTGTPEGVILGMTEKKWLKSGDVVTVEVSGLGRMTNLFVNEG